MCGSCAASRLIPAGLEEVLGRIRQRCEEELGNDRKVLLQ